MAALAGTKLNRDIAGVASHEPEYFAISRAANFVRRRVILHVGSATAGCVQHTYVSVSCTAEKS